MKKKLANPITYQDHAVDVLAQVATYVRSGQRFVLITSVDIKGGSARDLGSLAVVNDAGEMTGYMSNGCIDQDILLQALDCLQSGSARLLQYGDGSPFHDLTLPCGGSLSVWIDPSPGTACPNPRNTYLLSQFRPKSGDGRDYDRLSTQSGPDPCRARRNFSRHGQSGPCHRV